MFQQRRLANLILGMWLGAAGCVDLVVTQNFSAVDRFMSAPGTVGTAQAINHEGAGTTRFVLRRAAAEENAWIFENWEWIQIFVAVLFFLLVLFGDEPPKLALALDLALLAIVLAQRFILSPQVTALGREIADVPVAELANNSANTQFWLFHGLYGGSEILKLAVGFGLAATLMFRHRNTDRPPREYDIAAGAPKAAGERRSAGERRTGVDRRNG